MTSSTHNQTIADQLSRALALWVELTGVDPGATSYSINLGGGMDSYTVSKMYAAIKEALSLDPTNITGHLLLDAFSTRYFKERQFSVDELMQNPERTAAYVAQTKEFRELAQSAEIQELGDSFALSMRQALRHYGADNAATMELLANRHDLAFLRRDALRSMEQLRVDQFLKGTPEVEGTQPAYNGVVHQFWNINSLINTACRQPSGVTLNLIRDPDDFQSYFAFAIRNGGNLFVLSDVPAQCHPLQRYMSRRPDRAFGARAVRNWFPYDLLSIKYDEDSNRLYIDHSDQTGLIPLNQEADRLKALPELSPSEIVWIVMMFDLIVDRFWNKGYQAPELTYTGQMVREEMPLIEAAQRANLPVTGYTTLALPALTVAAIHYDRVSQAAIGHEGGAPNRWMEDRYAHLVDDELLNLLSKSGTDFYLPPIKSGDKRRSHQNHNTAVISRNAVVSVYAKDNASLAFWHKEGRYALHALDAASFGTRQELEDNRVFLARHNLAKGIQRLADEEFEARKSQIEAWWQNAIEKNMETLYRLSVVPQVWRAIDSGRFPSAKISGGGWSRKEYFQLAHRHPLSDPAASFRSQIFLSKGYRRRDDNFLCFVNGTASSYRVFVQPQTATDLAYLAGCPLEELPDVLQHWCARSDHKGNHLLGRIDPMAWILDNPWSALSFGVVMYLSVRGLRRLEKEYLPPEPWQLPPDEAGPSVESLFWAPKLGKPDPGTGQA